MTRTAGIVWLLCTASAWPLAAQSPVFDTSGNHLLNGTYYFRQVIYGISTSADTSTGITGDISQAIAVYGSITFDGNGNYTIAGGTAGGLVADSTSGAAPVPLSCYLANTSCTSGTAVSGTYSISASGYGFLASPVVTGDSISGLVSANGIFIGSSTETNFSYSDMFVAAPLASPQPANSTFQGPYTVTGFFPGGSPANSADAFFQVNPDGNGNLGTVNVTGYYGAGGSTTISQSNSNIKYFFSNGAAVVTFPTSSTANFFSGQEYLYFSPDGNFFFGGAPNGYDMLLGVRNPTGNLNFGGLYYEAGLDQDVSQLMSSAFANFDGYYGSLNATSSGDIVANDHVSSVFNSTAISSSYADSFTPPIMATYTDNSSSFQYAVGAGGAVRIGQGISPFLGITAALQAPTFSPAGSVYLDPTGVVNAASFSPFTAGISNGEFITLFGTNLASGTVVASNVPYPTTLGGVQVMINGVAAPIYYVSPGQLAVITPSSNPFALAQIQVINNNVASNTVTMTVNKTTPGVYTIPSGGIGNAAAVHTSGQIVSSLNPAAPGETIEVFLTGLGVAYPPVADGAAPPISPLSPTVNAITAGVDGTSATVLFAGLAPLLAGLYQVNVTIPSTTTSGDHTLDIGGPDSYAAQARISVGTGIASSSVRQPSASARRQLPRTPAVKKPLPCLFGNKPGCGPLQSPR